MDVKQTVLLVEDDFNFGNVLKSYLEIYDFEVVLKTDGTAGLSAFRKGSFVLCILDVMLPNMDGFTLGREIKKLNPEIPMIYLTAKTLKADMVEGFKTGADDYITKPFDTELLLLKIQAILKRQSGNIPQEIVEFAIGRYLFNAKKRTVKLEDEIQKLSPKETELLKVLCMNMNDVVPRELALQKVWNDDSYFTARSMDVFISRLRKLFKEDPSITIENIHGNGYCLQVGG